MLSGGVSTSSGEGGLGGLGGLLGSLGGGLGGLLGSLFGGGTSQSQQQSQSQNQSQTAQGGNAYSSSGVYNSGNSQNTNTITFPNQSAGYALQGLLGAQTPANVMNAQGPQSIAPMLASSTPGYNAPATMQAPAPSYAQAIPARGTFAQMLAGPTTGQGPTPPPAPQVATPSGGSFDPTQVAQAAMNAIQTSPNGSQFLNLPGSMIPALLASGAGLSPNFSPNPTYMEPRTDTTGQITGRAGGMPSAPIPSAGMSQKQWEGIKEEPQMDFAALKPSRQGSEVDRNEPIAGGDLFQIHGKHTPETKQALQAAYKLYAEAGNDVANRIVQTEAGPMPLKEYQAGMAQKIAYEEKRIAAAQKELDGIRKQAEQTFNSMAPEFGPNKAPVSTEEALVRKMAEREQLMGETAKNKIYSELEGWSPANNPQLEARVLNNRGFMMRLANLIRPGQLEWARNYATQRYNQLMAEYHETAPSVMEQMKAAHQAAIDAVDKDLVASREITMVNKSQLNSERYRENEDIRAQRSNALTAMERALQSESQARTADVMQAYHDAVTKHAMRALQETARHNKATEALLGESAHNRKLQEQLNQAREQRQAADELNKQLLRDAEIARLGAAGGLSHAQTLKTLGSKELSKTHDPFLRAGKAQLEGKLPQEYTPEQLHAFYIRYASNPTAAAPLLYGRDIDPQVLDEVFGDKLPED